MRHFRDSRAPSWLSVPRTDELAEPPRIGPAPHTQIHDRSLRFIHLVLKLKQY